MPKAPVAPPAVRPAPMGDPFAALGMGKVTNRMLKQQVNALACVLNAGISPVHAAAVSNAKTDSSFDLSIVNVDGSGSGIITLDGGTGVTKVGLMTVVATAGTAQMFRFRKTGTGTWTVYRIS